MDWPSLSVIIPSYNQGPYIERTLLSILRQDYPGPLQVIVSDGGSTDGTVDVLKRYPQVQWWSERDRGFVDAVTKGLAAATGEVVAIQSSDDYYLPGAFVKAAAALRHQKEIDFVTGKEVRIRENGQVFHPPCMPYVTLLNPGALIGNTPVMNIPQHCTFARRSAVDGVGGLREEVDYCADFDLWYRLLHFGRAVVLPDYLAACQVHASQRTQNKADLWISVLKKVVEDAERDPRYARRFLPTPEMKRDIFLQWDILWSRAAGGEEGTRRSRALAREALRQPDRYPDYVLDFIEPYSHEPKPSPPSHARSLARTALRRLKQNPGVRAMFGKGSLSRSELTADKVTLDLDWWKNKEPNR